MPAVTIYISEKELRELETLAELLNAEGEKTLRGKRFTPSSVASRFLRESIRREKKE